MTERNVSSTVRKVIRKKAIISSKDIESSIKKKQFEI